MEQSLIEMCQQHLIQALQDRIHATEQAIGQRFAFEVVQRDTTTAVFAHGWPQNGRNPPFHRVFHYRAPASGPNDALLERIIDDKLDAVVEVLPGAHQPASAQLLRAYGFQPVWHIPWFHLQLGSVEHAAPPAELIRMVAPAELAQLAAVLCTGYGYQGLEKEAWQAFAQYGYRAPSFTCFLATIRQHPAAAGVLHLGRSSALVDGAATLADYRGSGLQKALLAARLWYAQQHGAAHAFSRTGAGSISQANLEKIGMRLLVQSTAWRRI